jgi:hypothetical protein
MVTRTRLNVTLIVHCLARYAMLFKSWSFENFGELQYNIAKVIFFSQRTLHLCRQSTSTFKQDPVFPSRKSVFPSPAGIGARRSAGSFH